MRLIRTNVYQFKTLFDTSRPLALSTLMVQYHFFGDSVLPYHVFNVSVHLINAILVYALLIQLLRKKSTAVTNNQRLVAFAAAAIFATHPLQTQAVTYIVQRMTSLAALFFLGAVNLFLHQYFSNRGRGRFRQLLISIGILLMGLSAFLSKENAIVLPMILGLATLLYFPTRLKQRNVSNPVIAIMLLAVIFLAFIINRKTLTNYTPTLLLTPRGEYLTPYSYWLTQLAVLPKYLGQLIIPIRQNIDHGVPVTTEFGAQPAKGAFVIVGMLMLMGLMMRKRPMITFGIGWFLITMLVESSVFPINDVYVEHRLYLPLVGLLIAVAQPLYELLQSGKNAKKSAIFCLILLIFGLSYMTFRRNIIWQDDRVLWTDAAIKAPQNPRAQYNEALADLNAHDVPKAIDAFFRAIDANPKFHRAYNNLGALMFQQGEYQLSAKYFMMALSFNTEEELYDKNLNRAIQYLDSTDTLSPPPEMAEAMFH
ncbi:hypothetical protein KA012_04310 [Candidatus Woesebacteria bacterium]|nr:hypothetical protein [Candidatus Woesebacteria bacterium]